MVNHLHDHGWPGLDRCRFDRHRWWRLCDGRLPGKIGGAQVREDPGHSESTSNASERGKADEPDCAVAAAFVGVPVHSQSPPPWVGLGDGVERIVGVGLGRGVGFGVAVAWTGLGAGAAAGGCGAGTTGLGPAGAGS
jgi:hypothetical protein